MTQDDRSPGGNPGRETEMPGMPPDDAEALAAAQAEAADYRDQFLRAKAETENVRRQGQADVARAHKYGVERFAESLLPVRDALEQTLATSNATPEQLREGVELTLKQLVSAFDRAQLSVIDPAGEKFDPHRHQAMAMVEAPGPANSVAQVFQKGYQLADRVLRPALVAVSKGPQAGDGGAEAEPADDEVDTRR